MIPSSDNQELSRSHVIGPSGNVMEQNGSFGTMVALPHPHSAFCIYHFGFPTNSHYSYRNCKFPYPLPCAPTLLSCASSRKSGGTHILKLRFASPYLISYRFNRNSFPLLRTDPNPDRCLSPTSENCRRLLEDSFALCYSLPPWLFFGARPT